LEAPTFENLDLEWERADHTVLLRVRRPHARNAIDRATMEELDQAIEILETRPDVGCLVVTGDGDRAFVAGGDLKDFVKLETSEQGRAMGARMQAVLQRLEDLPFPTIAAIGANAYGGGCEVALACDLRVMSEGAHLIFSQARLGLITGWGGTPRLVRAVGPTVAMRILFTGEYLSASDAKELGLVASVAPEGLALATALDMARQITRHPQASIRAFKTLIRQCAEGSFSDAVALENELFATRWGSTEHQNAVREFLQRKPPTFSEESS